jgi:hypothetical protein
MGMHSAATFRTIGSAATTQNLFVILNTSSAQTVLVRRLVAQADGTVANITVPSVVRTCRVSTLTGGTALSKIDWATASASSAAVQVWGATNVDGAAGSPITASANTTLWGSYPYKLMTAVGQTLSVEYNLLPTLSATYPVTLAVNEGLSVRVNAPSASAAAATNHYIVQCSWEEV